MSSAFSGIQVVEAKKCRVVEEVHAIPCKTPFTGEAKVESYFIRESVDKENERASLRGRILEGKTLHLPEDFSAFLLSENTSKGYVVDGKVERIVYWEHDRQPSERSTLARAVAFLPVAAALAAPH